MGQVTRTNFGLTKIVTFTDAQIKALPTVPQTVIAAPGAGRAIFAMPALVQPCLVSLSLDWTADYTNIDAALTIGFALTGGLVYCDLLNAASKQFLAWGADVMWQISPADVQATGSDIQNWTDFENKPLVLNIKNGAAGNLTGGNAANVLKVTVFYCIVSL